VIVGTGRTLIACYICEGVTLCAIRMTSKFLILFVLILIGTSTGTQLFAHDQPERILQRMSDYYESLNSFEGINTIRDRFAPNETVNTRRFAFLRPNKFVIIWGTNALWDTDNPGFLCDGTNIYNYEPYYHNSYTRVPAPRRFEEAITNWIGGEMLLLIANTNPFAYSMSGFGRGLTALRYAGHEKINGVDCDHLHFQEPRSETVELWVARGASPYAVKYVAQFPRLPSTNEMMDHAETISKWKANAVISGAEFVFSPTSGAIEHGSDGDQVEVTSTATDHGTKDTVKFIAPGDKTDAEALADFLKANQERFRAVALKGIFAKYKKLAAGDLAFVNVQPSPSYDSDKAFVATFVLSNTVKTTETSRSVQTTEETFNVTLSQAGELKSVSKGTSMSFRSK
jgi:hypothetical protein